MRKVICLSVLLLLASIICLPQDSGNDPLVEVRIGMVFDGPQKRNAEIGQTFRKEIRELLRGEFRVIFSREKNITATWTAASVKTALQKLMNDPEVDVILAMGVMASEIACDQLQLDKPVIAPFIIDYRLQSIPFEKGASGKKNLSYLTSTAFFRNDLTVFRNIVPFTTLALVYDPVLTATIPDFKELSNKVTSDMGLKLHLVPITSPVKKSLQCISSDTDAVVISPLLRLPDEDFRTLVNGLITRRLPSFSMWGRSEVEKGLLIGLKPEIDFRQLARLVGMNIQSILHGEAASDLPVVYSGNERLSINMATARAIKFYPKWSVLTDAELINAQPAHTGKKWTIFQAIDQALTANLQLLAKTKAVESSSYETKKARTTLLPRIDVSTTASIIDADRAKASLGAMPERQWWAASNISQLIYSDKVLAGIRIEDNLQLSREQELEGQRLDIIQEAATAYFNVLQAKTTLAVQKENLKVSQSNLEFAKTRQAVGISSLADVYRWESEIANSRRAVLIAQTQLKVGEINLKRIIHISLAKTFQTTEIGLDDPGFLTGNPKLMQYLDNPWDFKTFIEFMVKEGISSSPEIKQIDALIAAQKRAVTSFKRARWAPTVSAQGEVSHILKKGGAGSDGASSLPPEISEAFPSTDKTNWYFGLNVSFPLFTGGSKYIELHQSYEELARLNLERQLAVEIIEQRIRSNLAATQYSFPNIRLTHEAAEAARKNLELVTSSYIRGIASIVDLLDAQNAALTSKELSSNAVYNFLIDFMNVQRSAGRFLFLTSPAEQQNWTARLEAHFKEASEKDNAGR